jgi:hypothetical protein
MIKSRYCKAFFILLSLAFCASSEPLLAGATGTAVTAGIWDLRDQTINPDLLIVLNDYNRHYYNTTNIKLDSIAAFLNDEIRNNHLDPNLFRYFVGVDLDWQIAKRTNGYALIIPDATSSNLDFVKSLFTSTSAKSAYSLNIRDLDKTLRENNTQRLPEYRLAIVKAIVAAENKGLFRGLSSALAQSTFAYLGEGAKAIQPYLQHAFTALAIIYPMITSNNQWVAYQKALDNYILNSLDLELIEAHIKDLEQQFTEEKGSITTKLWSYIPSNSSKSKSALEKRIEIMKNFITENDLELRLMKSIRNKKKTT